VLEDALDPILLVWHVNECARPNRFHVAADIVNDRLRNTDIHQNNKKLKNIL